MKLIVTEKPSVASDIGKIVGASTPKDGYLEGNGYLITWAFGHLVGLVNPEMYDEKYKSWSLDLLPIIPDEFIYSIAADKGKRKQCATIHQLLKSSNVKEIICATDAGREGEAIFRYIYDASGCNKPFKRLWISSLTEEAIKKGLKSLSEGKDFDNLYYSAKARNEADWTVGINATRALTKACCAKEVLSIGRVQTPTLALICSRFYEHKNFIPTISYIPFISLGTNPSCEAKSNLSFQTKEECLSFLETVSEQVAVKHKDLIERNERPPLPFDLTSLQAAANRKYGYKAQETLDIAQSLYEKYKLTTYPRTASRYLPEDMYSSVSSQKHLLIQFKDSYKLANEKSSKFCFNNGKLTDHHAIIPTFQNFDRINNLTDKERNVFFMIVHQLMLALGPICKKNTLSYVFEGKNESLFYVSGTRIIEKGWRAILLDESQEDDQEDEDESILPDLKLNEIVNITEKEAYEAKTKRPGLHSEATLLQAMETAGKHIDDPDQKEALKDCGLGTPATRASIIETLFARKYILTKGKQLIPTELGLEVYNVIKDNVIANVSFTGEWEHKLNQIANGEYAFNQFAFEIREYVETLVPELIELGKNVHAATKGKLELKCPLCSSEVRTFTNHYGCTAYNNEENKCTFTLSKVIHGVTITTDDLSDICNTGATKVKTFKKADGKEFRALLKLNTETKRLEFFAPTYGNCPGCKSPIKEHTSAYYCSNKDCNFSVFKKISGREIKLTELRDLLSKRRTKLLDGFISKTGKSFKAHLIVNEDLSLKFEFEKKK